MNKASGGDGIPVKVLHSICQQIWKTQQWPQDWKRSFFIPTPKKGNIKVIQVYAPTSNTEEAEVERFYEDLQDLLELTPKRDVLFIIGDWMQK